MEQPHNADGEAGRKDSGAARTGCSSTSRKCSPQAQTESCQEVIRIIKEDSKASDTDSGWSATAACSVGTSVSCSNLLDAQTTKLKSESASSTMIDIAVRNEEDEPDYVDIDKADDEDERETDIVPPLVTILPRLPSSEHIRLMQPPIISVGSELASKFRAQSIAERVLKRRNSENALQQVMQVAQSRKETLAKLINEHQKLVKEVEKWSSLACLKENWNDTSNGCEQSPEQAPSAQQAQAGNSSR